MSDTAIPSELRRLDQWLAYRAIPKPNGKINKPPINARTGGSGSSTNPETWSGYDPAAARSPKGAAFVLTEDDPYVVIDLDDVRNPQTGGIEPWALATIERFNTYTELSFSGRGVHIIMRGVKPGNDCAQGAQIECYEAGRYIVLTGNVLDGRDAIRWCQPTLKAWYRETFPERPEPAPTVTAPTMTLDDRDIIERIRGENGTGKGARLLAGDASDYPSTSEARMALAYKCLFWGADPNQTERILRAHGPWRDDDSERERDRKAKHDAATAAKAYRGDRYRPGHRTTDGTAGDATPTETIDAMSCDTVRAQLKAAQQTIAGLQQRNDVQARMLREERKLRDDIETILKTPNTTIEAGKRIAAIGVVLELFEQERRGRTPTEDGYQIPAVWIARRVGYPGKTTNDHLKWLNDRDLVPRTIKQVLVGEEYVDLETGEITIIDEPRKAGFIAPDRAAIVTNFRAYQRQAEDKQHGGKREPRCDDHPDAPTVKKWTVHCGVCNKVLEAGTTTQPPAEARNTQDADSVSLPPPVGLVDIPKMRIPEQARTGNTKMRIPDTALAAEPRPSTLPGVPTTPHGHWVDGP